MLRGVRLSKLIIQCSAVIVTLWLCSNLVYVVDHSYR